MSPRMLHIYSEELRGHVKNHDLVQIATKLLRGLLQSQARIDGRGWATSRIARYYYELWLLLSNVASTSRNLPGLGGRPASLLEQDAGLSHSPPVSGKFNCRWPGILIVAHHRSAAGERTRADMFRQMFTSNMDMLDEMDLSQMGVSKDVANWYVGGRSQSEKDTQQADSDRVQSRFRRDDFKNPNYSGLGESAS